MSRRLVRLVKEIPSIGYRDALTDCVQRAESPEAEAALPKRLIVDVETPAAAAKFACVKC